MYAVMNGSLSIVQAFLQKDSRNLNALSISKELIHQIIPLSQFMIFLLIINYGIEMMTL